jgi:pilus assembly protein CpaB
MNSRFTIMFIVALAFAGSAAWMAKRWVDSQSLPITPTSESVPVVVATMKIPFATRVEPTQIKTVNWPKDSVPPDAFNDMVPVIGKVTQRDFYPNEIILKPQIADHAGGSTLSALIQPGMRAMSVRVDDVVGVAGFILPGNRADILITNNEGGGTATKTLLKNMKILAIDQLASTEQDKPAVVRSLTLEVTPKQAEILVTAMRSSALMFTLRNPMDTEQSDFVEAKVESGTPVKIKTVARSISIMVLPWASQTPYKITETGKEAS